jgi:sulfate permease, SulP family
LIRLTQAKDRLLLEIKEGRSLSNLVGGLITGIVAVTFSTAFSALVFSGDLSAYATRGVGLMLVGSMIIAALTTVLSSMRGLAVHLQENAVAILAVVSAAIVSQLPSSATSEAKFATVVVAIALSSIMTGAVFLFVGQFKLGNFIRFIPYPVVGGFLAGSGLLLVQGAFAVLTGAPISFLLSDPAGEFAQWLRWLPSLLFAIGMLLALRRRNHVLTVPALLIAGTVGFFVLLRLTNTSIETAAQQGWLVGISQWNGSLWQPLSLSDLMQVNWPVLGQQIGNLFFVAIVSLIAILLNATGIELATAQDADLNRDLKAAGVANLLAGLVGSPVGYHASDESGLIYGMGARSRLVGFVLAVVCGVVLLLGGPILGYLPNPILGGLLLFLGLGILVTWVYDSWFKLPIGDYLVIIVILVAINTIGILEGVGLGIIFGIILFVIDYSRIDVVKHALTGATYRSKVNRPRRYEQLLHREGESLYILELQGFIFFGTVQKLLDLVRKRIDDHNLPRMTFMVLDFRLIHGVDSSAVLGLTKMKQLTHTRGINLVFTQLSTRMQNQMKEIFQADDAPHIFVDLDHGVEWCENQIIAAHVSAGLERPLTLMNQLETALPPSIRIEELLTYFEERQIGKGECIIKQGEDSVGLYFIENGQVTVQLEGDDTKVTRIRTMQTGTVVGELGFYLRRKATASVVADEPCKVLYLSAEKLKKMETTAPAIASAFHKFIVQMLSERLIETNESLQALTT